MQVVTKNQSELEKSAPKPEGRLPLPRITHSLVLVLSLFLISFLLFVVCASTVPFHSVPFLSVDDSFRSYVLDYTDFRCRRFTNCWFFWVGDGGGNNDTNFCQAPGAYFHHGKKRNVFGKLLFSTNVTTTTSSPSSPMRSMPFVNRYRHNCMDLPKDQ